MRFNIAMMAGENFGYLHFLFDTAKLLKLSLESLGHSCCITKNNLEKNRTNILIASHTLINPSVVRQVIDSRVDYVVLQSEVISKGEVNHRYGPSHYEGCYVPLLRNARAVWECVPGQLPILEKLGIGGEQFPLGYHFGMREIRPKRTRDVDFLFYGSMTEHRQRLLQGLSRQQRCHRSAGQHIACPGDGLWIGRWTSNVAEVVWAGPRGTVSTCGDNRS